MSIIELLKRLEEGAKRLIVNLFPTDEDAFVHALVGDRAEQYRHGDGFDVIKALSDTAVQDWAEEAANLTAFYDSL